MKYLIFILLFGGSFLLNAQLPIELKSFITKAIDFDRIEVVIDVETELNVSHYLLIEDDFNHKYVVANNSKIYKEVIKPVKSNGIITLKVVDFDGSESIYYAKYNLPEIDTLFDEYDYAGRLLRKNISKENFHNQRIYYSATLTLKR